MCVIAISYPEDPFSMGAFKIDRVMMVLICVT